MEEPELTGDLPLLADGTPAPLNLTYTGCGEQFAVIPVPMSEFESQVPDGLEPMPFDPAGEFASLLVIAWSCGFDEGDVTEGWMLLAVEAQGEYDNEADHDALLLGALGTSEKAIDILSAWAPDGDFEVGRVELSFETTPVARHGSLSAGSGSFDFNIDTLTQGPAADFPAGTARVFTADDGEVSGAVDLEWTDGMVVENGEALGYMMGVEVPPAYPGIGIHYWGDDYDYQLNYVDPQEFMAAEEEMAEDSGNATVALWK